MSVPGDLPEPLTRAQRYDALLGEPTGDMQAAYDQGFEDGYGHGLTDGRDREREAITARLAADSADVAKVLAPAGHTLWKAREDREQSRSGSDDPGVARDRDATQADRGLDGQAGGPGWG